MINTQSNKKGNLWVIRRFIRGITYENLKSSMKWFLETASIKITISVR
jgi:hypothetical protein